MFPPAKDELAELQAVIERLHHCASRWISGVSVIENHGGRSVWAGEVQVFALLDHPTATRAYAWSHETQRMGRRYFAVLHVSPVDSAQAAVRASIVDDFRNDHRV